ncbi:MAG: MotA/TolQ/ExbB proton channel family protein [Planctomycetota bacterium]|nr:MotA/TolQ/ExbB proton channel family protein [Planctomycetota bacterium]
MDKIIQYFNNGGPLMWPILLCSVVSWAIIIERAIRLRRIGLVDDELVKKVRAALGKGDLAGAEQAAQAHPVLVGVVLAKGIDEFRYTEADLETSLQAAAERNLQVLWNNMGALNTIARVATLLGLLGTVVGMVWGFEQLTQQGVAKEKLAEAIGVALVTTVGGLCVAIPAIIGESALKSKIRKLTIEFEEILLEVIKAAKIGGITKRSVARKAGTPREPPRALTQDADGEIDGDAETILDARDLAAKLQAEREAKAAKEEEDDEIDGDAETLMDARELAAKLKAKRDAEAKS